MKKLFLLLLLMPVVVIAGVGTPTRDEVRHEFVKACVDSGDPQMPNEATKQLFRKYCECSGDKVAASYTIDELKEINRVSAGGGTERDKERIQKKLMAVIKPCLDEFTKEVAKTVKE